MDPQQDNQPDPKVRPSAKPPAIGPSYVGSNLDAKVDQQANKGEPQSTSIFANSSVSKGPASINSNQEVTSNGGSSFFGSTKGKLFSVLLLLLVLGSITGTAMLLNTKNRAKSMTTESKAALSSDASQSSQKSTEPKATEIASDICPADFIETTKRFGSALKAKDNQTVNSLLTTRFRNEIQAQAGTDPASAIQQEYAAEIAANDLNVMNVTAIFPSTADKTRCVVVFSRRDVAATIGFNVVDVNKVKLIDNADYRED
jgi:hypothetical protein